MNGLNGAAPDRIEAAPVRRWRRSAIVAAATAAPSGPGQRVVVRPGQSVGYLAREYGVTKRAIIEANDLTPPEYKIEIGKTLVIPGGAGAQRGDARRCAPLRRKSRPRRLRSAQPLLPEPRKPAKSSRSTSPRRRRGNRQRRRRSAFRRRSASAKRQAVSAAPPKRKRAPAEKTVAEAEAGRAGEPRRASSVAGARPRSRRLRRDKGAAATMTASTSPRRAARRSKRSMPAPSPMPATRCAATATSCWSSMPTA